MLCKKKKNEIQTKYNKYFIFINFLINIKVIKSNIFV